MLYTKVYYRKRKDYFEVCIYYSKFSKVFLHTTNVKVRPENLSKKKKEISKNHPNYIQTLNTINTIQIKVENAIKKYFSEHSELPHPEDISDLLIEQDNVKAQKIGLLVYFDEFIKYKEQFISVKGSLRPHLNLGSTLEQYEDVRKRKFTLNEIDSDFLNDFIYFTSQEKIDSRRIKEKVVGINDSTLIKRINSLIQYLKYCRDEHNIKLDIDKITSIISNIKRKNRIKNYIADDKLSLTQIEVEELYNFKCSDHLNKTKDFFLFQCLTGQRISDVKSFDSKFHVIDGIIKKTSVKTRTEFQVELHSIAEEILIKYPIIKISEPVYNRELKELFKEYYLSKFKEQDKRLDKIITIKKYGKEIPKIYKLWELVSSHSGRSTFLNMLTTNKELSINEIMQRGGWKRIETLNNYLDNKMKITNRKDIFDIKKL